MRSHVLKEIYSTEETYVGILDMVFDVCLFF